jgi:hypothetical protein
MGQLGMKNLKKLRSMSTGLDLSHLPHEDCTCDDPKYRSNEESLSSDDGSNWEDADGEDEAGEDDENGEDQEGDIAGSVDGEKDEDENGWATDESEDQSIPNTTSTLIN